MEIYLFASSRGPARPAVGNPLHAYPPVEQLREPAVQGGGGPLRHDNQNSWLEDT